MRDIGLPRPHPLSKWRRHHPGSPRLEGSCECYGVSKKEFDRLLGDRALPKVRAGKM
jgi:hypothetical protein